MAIQKEKYWVGGDDHGHLKTKHAGGGGGGDGHLKKMYMGEGVGERMIMAIYKVHGRGSWPLKKTLSRCCPKGFSFLTFFFPFLLLLSFF